LLYRDVPNHYDLMQCCAGVNSTVQNRDKKYEERGDIITAVVMHRHSSLRLLVPKVCIMLHTTLAYYL